MFAQNLLIFCLGLIENLLIALYLSFWLKSKYGWRGIISFPFIMQSTLFFIHYIQGMKLSEPSMLRAVGMQIIIYIVVMWLYEETCIKKTFVYVTVVAMQIMVEFLTTLINWYWLGIGSIEEVSNDLGTFAIMKFTFNILSGIVMLVVFYIFRKRSFAVESTDIKLFIAFPISQCVTCLLFFFNAIKIDDQAVFNVICLVMVFNIATDIMMFVAIHKLGQKKIADEKVELLEKQLELQVKHYEENSELESQLRELRHDVGNQLQVIKSLLEEKSYDEATEFSIEIEKYLSKLQSVNYCHNKIVNALLRSKYKEAEKQGIHFEADIQLTDDVNISRINLCRLYSNILDNAIAAAAGKEKGYIKINAQKKGNYSVIVCENNFAGEIFKNRRGQIISDKGVGRGNGLKIIETLVEQHSGNMEITIQNDIFKIKVALRIF